jgi:hypothetical protein
MSVILGVDAMIGVVVSARGYGWHSLNSHSAFVQNGSGKKNGGDPNGGKVREVRTRMNATP